MPAALVSYIVIPQVERELQRQRVWRCGHWARDKYLHPSAPISLEATSDYNYIELVLADCSTGLQPHTCIPSCRSCCTLAAAILTQVDLGKVVPAGVCEKSACLDAHQVIALVWNELPRSSSCMLSGNVQMSCLHFQVPMRKPSGWCLGTQVFGECSLLNMPAIWN